MKFILTSYLDLCDKDENGNRIAKNFGNKNNILDNIKKYVKKYDNFETFYKCEIVQFLKEIENCNIK